VSRQRLEAADVVRRYRAALLERCGGRLSAWQRKALADIGSCRTAALGGHLEQCDSCSARRIAYNSCRNRHCPKCQATARDRWLEARSKELLPVRYSHVVFTVPQQLAALALHNQQLFYGLLFAAASQALLELAADPRRLGAKIGFFAVLHTWSQTLLFHPHIHCVVPAGGLALDGKRWISSRRKFFLPVKPLSRLFRGKLLDGLRRAFANGELRFPGSLAELADERRFHAFRRELGKLEWVVYAKRPFRGPTHVLQYLARYTHRVAISNGRLAALEDGRVRFRYRDSKRGNQILEMSLDAVEFLRRFLLHVLPRGLVKIRHFGWMANRNRSAALERCRELLAAAASADDPAAILSRERRQALERRCPACGQGRLHIVAWLSAAELLLAPPPLVRLVRLDSS